MSAERTLQEYIDEVASAAPAPGGGSVTGVVGALAAALGQMVLNLTAVPAHTNDSARHRHLLEALQASRERLLQGAAADEQAYQGYRDASALPRSTADEKAARRNAMQAALIAATDVPLAMAEEAGRLISLLAEVGVIGNRHLTSDTALGVLLAEATMRGALLNVRGNAAMLRDVGRAQHYREAADRIETAGRRAVTVALELASTAAGS